MRRSLVAPVVIAALLCPAGAAAAASARGHATPSADSVVSLLAPAHGAAFAFQTAGELLTTRRAVGSATSVEVVTRTGEHALAPVLDTNKSGIVLLDVNLNLRPLPSGHAVTHAHLAVQPGPLDGPARRRGRLLDGHTGAMSVNSGRSYEGAPVIDIRGAVIGVATQDGHRLRSLSVAGIHATSLPTIGQTTTTGPSGSHVATAGATKASGGTHLPGWAWALVGAAVALLLVGLVVLDSAHRRRVRRERRARAREQAAEEPPGPDTLEYALRPLGEFDVQPAPHLPSEGESQAGDAPDEQE